MIKVYFETPQGTADHIATFYNEEAYAFSVDLLEAWADNNKGFITESMAEEETV
jgi:hypothetical protein